MELQGTQERQEQHTARKGETGVLPSIPDKMQRMDVSIPDVAPAEGILPENENDLQYDKNVEEKGLGELTEELSDEEDIDLETYFLQLLDQIRPKYNSVLRKALAKEFRSSGIRVKLDLIRGLEDDIREQNSPNSTSQTYPEVEQVEEKSSGTNQFEKTYDEMDDEEVQDARSQLSNALDLADEDIDKQVVDSAWEDLLNETLPPASREALSEQYYRETSYRKRYHMLLEFSSYLRQATSYPDVAQVDEKPKTGIRRRNTGKNANFNAVGPENGMGLQNEDELDKYLRRTKGDRDGISWSVVFLIISIFITVYIANDPSLITSFLQSGV